MATQLKITSTEKAPKAIGPYSQAISANGFVFTAGQIPLEPESGEMIKGGIHEQTERVLENLKSVLEASNSSLSRVLKTTVYLSDMNNFASMNEVYSKFFSNHKPARSTVQVARLPKDSLVEIEAIAALNE